MAKHKEDAIIINVYTHQIDPKVEVKSDKSERKNLGNLTIAFRDLSSLLLILDKTIRKPVKTSTTKSHYQQNGLSRCFVKTQLQELQSFKVQWTITRTELTLDH